MTSQISLNPKPQKRDDIQILRAYLVVTVVVYHLRPEWIPHGFLAVDAFFVISGYLMAKILRFGLSDAQFTMTKILNFYHRRFKRLVPTYIFVLLITTIIGSKYLIPTDFKGISLDSRWALAFSSNIQTIMKKKSYFKMTSEFYFFLHSWSLSVEAQYYLLSPFLFALLSIKWPLFGLIITTIASFLLQTLIVTEIVAFNFIFCRIWQFLVGAIVFFAESRRPHLYAAKSKLILWRIMLIGTTVMPNLSILIVLRLVTTIATGMALFTGKYATEKLDKGFWVAPVAYIGDASYSIYLVHWPVIMFFKYFEVLNTTPLIITIIVVFVLSILNHHYIEKPFAKLNLSRTVSVCAIIYFLTIATALFPGIFTSPPPLALKNDQISQHCNIVPASTTCNWDPEILTVYPKSTKSASFACSYDGHGNATVFVTGNSFALRQVEAVRAALNGNYKKLYFVARPGCTTFDHYNDLMHVFFKCHEVKGKIEAFLKKFKPDIMIISQLLHPLNETRPKNETDNETVQIVQNYFKTFATYTKAVIHIEPHHRFSLSPPLAIARYISLGKPLDTLYMTEEYYNSTVNPTWNLVLRAMQNCPTCHAIPIRQAFCSNGTCPSYDAKTQLSLFCDDAHLSAIGIERMVEPLKKYLDPLMENLFRKRIELHD